MNNTNSTQVNSLNALKTPTTQATSTILKKITDAIQQNDLRKFIIRFDRFVSNLGLSQDFVDSIVSSSARITFFTTDQLHRIHVRKFFVSLSPTQEVVVGFIVKGKYSIESDVLKFPYNSYNEVIVYGTKKDGEDAKVFIIPLGSNIYHPQQEILTLKEEMKIPFLQQDTVYLEDTNLGFAQTMYPSPRGSLTGGQKKKKASVKKGKSTPKKATPKAKK